eukprot:TRINITY_DN23413_c0_g2_i1.p1 TRINITY_DN23413_c0_g2~~TRINITY_DN23413_c0_g2_i1.p1  ORF type:complete len:507 (+),score=120.48 TRINITY_DN23413_c0_g2_i1:212-1732(+)
MDVNAPAFVPGAPSKPLPSLSADAAEFVPLAHAYTTQSPSLSYDSSSLSYDSPEFLPFAGGVKAQLSAGELHDLANLGALDHVGPAADQDWACWNAAKLDADAETDAPVVEEAAAALWGGDGQEDHMWTGDSGSCHTAAWLPDCAYGEADCGLAPATQLQPQKQPQKQSEAYSRSLEQPAAAPIVSGESTVEVIGSKVALDLLFPNLNREDDDSGVGPSPLPPPPPVSQNRTAGICRGSAPPLAALGSSAAGDILSTAPAAARSDALVGIADPIASVEAASCASGWPPVGGWASTTSASAAASNADWSDITGLGLAESVAAMALGRDFLDGSGSEGRSRAGSSRTAGSTAAADDGNAHRREPTEPLCVSDADATSAKKADERLGAGGAPNQTPPPAVPPPPPPPPRTRAVPKVSGLTPAPPSIAAPLHPTTAKAAPRASPVLLPPPPTVAPVAGGTEGAPRRRAAMPPPPSEPPPPPPARGSELSGLVASSCGAAALGRDLGVAAA